MCFSKRVSVGFVPRRKVGALSSAFSPHAPKGRTETGYLTPLLPLSLPDFVDSVTQADTSDFLDF